MTGTGVRWSKQMGSVSAVLTISKAATCYVYTVSFSFYCEYH